MIPDLPFVSTREPVSSTVRDVDGVFAWFRRGACYVSAPFERLITPFVGRLDDSARAGDLSADRRVAP
jgi:hypothetical protein